MATQPSTIEFIEDQLSALPGIRTRKMFGEYALYVGNKVVALVCDDRLFVKPTAVGRDLARGGYREGRAYPGAKPSLKLAAHFLEDRERLTELIRLTAAALPEPSPKRQSPKHTAQSRKKT